MKIPKFLKTAVKSTLSTVVSRLPGAARLVIVDQFTRDGTIAYDKFLAIAKRFNVTALSVRGEYGVFQSTSDDASVLGSYAGSETWAAETNGILQEFFSQRGGGTYLDVGANIASKRASTLTWLRHERSMAKIIDGSDPVHAAVRSTAAGASGCASAPDRAHCVAVSARRGVFVSFG